MRDFDQKRLFTEFIHSFEAGDLTGMKEYLAEKVKSHITSRDGGTNLLVGRDAFIHNLEKLDVRAVKPTLTITQMVSVSEDQVMAMVEIKANRKGKYLHNFATFLISFKARLMSEIYMVEALPAYSHTFWKG